jgi:hypothetical protein
MNASQPRLMQCFGLMLLLPMLVGAAGSQVSDVAPHGRAYFVDSVAGSDNNSGSNESSAWKTLAKVNATTFAPGDHILFKSGDVWTGQFWPKGSGNTEHPIIIDKYGGEARPIINAADEAEDAVLLKNQEYWEINNLEITNTGSGARSRRGVNLVAENSGDLHHLYIRNLDIHDVNGSDSDKVNGGILYHCIGDTKPSRFVDLRIENNHIHHVDRSGIFGWSTHWVRSKWYPSFFDHNLYFGTQRTPEDVHAVTKDPRFINAGGASVGRQTASAYALQPSSPAIGSGRPISEFGGRDFLGTPVPECAVDRGAIQSSKACK